MENLKEHIHERKRFQIRTNRLASKSQESSYFSPSQIGS